LPTLRQVVILAIRTVIIIPPRRVCGNPLVVSLGAATIN
jgi:hypothetical protein